MILLPLLVAFAFGQIARISFSNQLINFYLYEVILLFYLASLIFKYKLGPVLEEYKRFYFFYWFIGAMLFSTLVTSLSFNFTENIIALLYLLRPVLYFLFFIYSLRALKKQELPYQKSLTIFIWITLITSVIQYLFYPNLRNLYYLGWDPHYFRAFGVFFEPAVAAAIFGLITIRLLFSKKNYLNSFFILSFTILGLLTYSRGFYLAAGLTAIIFFLKNRLYKQLFLFVVLIAFALFILPKPTGEGGKLGRTSTIHSRLVDYQQGANLWKTKPVFGVGYNHLPFLKQSVGEEQIAPDHSKSAFQSTYLTILITTGGVGLIIFLLTLNQIAALNDKALYYTIFLAFFSIIDNIFLQPFVFFLFFYLIAGELTFRKLR